MVDLVATPPVVGAPDLVQIGLPDPNLVPYSFVATNGVGFQFNRTWAVTFIGLQGPRIYNSLRTSFEVEKTSYSDSNKVKLKIYNLSDLSMATYLKDAKVSLAIGYSSVNFPLFTNAAVIRVSHERKGADLVSSFEMGESEQELTESIVNLTFPAGTNSTAVISQLIGLMGLIPGPAVGLIPKVYSKGLALSSTCKKAMDTVLGPSFSWSVQGKFVVIRPKGTPVGATFPVNLTTGLLGAPNMGAGSGGDNTLTFRALANANYVPGTTVLVSSRFIGAPVTAVIQTSKFEGDTHESKWEVKCECSPINLAAVNVVGT